ncbi:MAG: hypothetical protein IT344_07160 [Candidatus Dadabacteria bacterium]|nr:hypothetical protein [Candidatus Dadabacteria bacterium]
MTYVDELVQVFEGALEGIPGLGSPALSDELRAEIVSRKYDLQDEGFIEAILRQDREDFTASFADVMKDMIAKLPSDAEREEFLKSDETKKEAIRVFIASLEHMINYYHTSMIGKHFSST